MNSPTCARLRGLYGIADAGVRPEVGLDAKVRAFLDGGACAVQLRLKGRPARELLERAREAVALAAGRALVVINDRPDVALAAGADGVHLGDEDLPVEEVRRIAGSRLLIGATVRTLEQAREAAARGADYVGFGPVWPTSTKPVAATARGLAALREVAAGAPVPVVAIGGIGVERAAEVARAGAAAAAVVSDVLTAKDMAGRARQFSERFFEAKRGK